MTYDIIEKFVKSQSSDVIPAKYVQHEGQIQFEEVTPLESEPKLAELQHYMQLFARNIRHI